METNIEFRNGRVVGQYVKTGVSTKNTDVNKAVVNTLVIHLDNTIEEVLAETVKAIVVDFQNGAGKWRKGIAAGTSTSGDVHVTLSGHIIDMDALKRQLEALEADEKRRAIVARMTSGDAGPEEVMELAKQLQQLM